MSPAAGAVADHLRARLGDGAAAPPALLARLAVARHTVPYVTAVAPADADGVAAALAICGEEGWPVRALGAGTWLGGRTRAPVATEPPPVLISTMRLRRVVEHEPADLVVGAEAGLPLAELRQHLDMHRQFLPLDPPGDPDATVGAVAALGASGPLRAGHGTVRDMALGLRIATGDGRLLHFGGRVVKNVAGYDGVRLVVGSGGSLGVITEIYLRVRGAPRADRTVLVACGRSAEGYRRSVELAGAVRQNVQCDALELLSPAVVGQLGAPGADEWSLLIRILGSEAAVEEATARVGAVTARERRAAMSVPVDVWRRLGALEAAAGAAIRICGAAAALAEGLEMAQRLAGGLEESGGWCCAAHAADGVIRLWRDSWRTSAGHEAVNEGWTVRYSGLPTAVDAPDPAGDPAVDELAGRVRRVFDPAGILGGGGWQ